MRIGIMAGTGGRNEASVDSLVAHAQRIEELGFHTLWLAHVMAFDALSTLAVIGRETRTLELGTAVVPTYLRHPLATAQQALTTQAMSGGRFTLGLGLSHQVMIEGVLGLSYDRPARHMREYLEVLTPLLRGDAVDFRGEVYQVKAALEVPEAPPVPVVVAALGPVMLGIAGRMAQGTITWMTGPKTLESYVVPTLRSAADRAGRPEPRVVAGLPIALCSDADAARENLAQRIQIYGTLPSYRAMLDREGAAGPADVALVGDEATLSAGLQRLREIGVSDFDAAIVSVEPGCTGRTLEFLASQL
jgi:F420-dependent oxidoreductase-like protein